MASNGLAVHLTQLSLADKQTAKVNQSCVQARGASVRAQTTAAKSAEALREAKREARTMRSTSLAEQAATAKYLDKLETSRQAGRTLKTLEQELKMAQAENAAVQHDSDRYLASEDLLPLRCHQRELISGPYAAWLARCDQAFTNYSQITNKHQIAPPPLPEGQNHTLSCKDTPRSRPIEACECAVRSAFRSDRTINLRAERLRWSPENFTDCDEAVRGELVSTAAYVFKVVDAMYQSIPR
ncbi:hypothetical protein B0A50_03931 [Salinomyces thailandicus]|uniref:Uncharacterized protein n=1 Tax=Salinomyces thailandicus TaxID=706561 RepID=A0A4U0U196_9PEZI|nr:hypothetical protein B0A50_03931 [Salinomyces thailandica]